MALFIFRTFCSNPPYYSAPKQNGETEPFSM
uniref:Uncharacterized protein n=1 Tax=Anguilla anguilla TaxID=7936 RepID=A0A0E9W769_ANGAN